MAVPKSSHAWLKASLTQANSENGRLIAFQFTTDTPTDYGQKGLCSYWVLVISWPVPMALTDLYGRVRRCTWAKGSLEL